MRSFSAIDNSLQAQLKERNKKNTFLHQREAASQKIVKLIDLLNTLNQFYMTYPLPASTEDIYAFRELTDQFHAAVIQFQPTASDVLNKLEELVLGDEPSDEHQEKIGSLPRNYFKQERMMKGIFSLCHFIEDQLAENSFQSKEELRKNLQHIYLILLDTSTEPERVHYPTESLDAVKRKNNEDKIKRMRYLKTRLQAIFTAQKKDDVMQVDEHKRKHEHEKKHKKKTDGLHHLSEDEQPLKKKQKTNETARKSSVLSPLGFDSLPTELGEIIGHHLDPKSLPQASLVCYNFYLFLHKPLAIAADALALLQHVMLGKEALASKSSFLLKTSSQHYWHAVLKKSCGTDPSGRYCEASSLEYAAWAGDTDVVNMFLLDMPDEYLATALAQLRGIKDKGMKTDKGYEKHLSAVLSLISAKPNDRALMENMKILSRVCPSVVRAAQKHAPTVCSVSKLPSRELKVSKGLGNPVLVSVYEVDELGASSVLMKDRGARPAHFMSSISKVNTVSGLNAIRKYHEVRTRDLAEQILRLEQRLGARQQMEF